MFWLTIHMWFLLLSAFVIGVGTGWWMSHSKSSAQSGKSDDIAHGTLDLDAPKSPEA